MFFEGFLRMGANLGIRNGLIVLYITWVTGGKDLRLVILGTKLMEKEILERRIKDTKAEEKAMAEEHNGQKTVNSNLVEIKSNPCLV